ncbi:transmembrane emp24 domain-containing protein 7-like [Mizuhopecten yessoensis]|uniref:Transmembrane emp24 domain-containing protein 7 n=1 Tax=Mizuhopecten yessoensis TaxID=6573 RepID=A0A210R7D6_MIZYE|nr:transmembrane emp24 domain-containing protein 7-like [Mizuhopecten yessoensis]OWF56834.1 Transmembrane emp24 domain-containing protein 7 [Mizuhopecten yessoensis]
MAPLTYGPWILIVLFLSCYESVASGTALTFELPETEKVCFTEKFRDMTAKLLVYKVLRGGNNDINVWILSPNGKVVYRADRTTEDKVLFDSSYGEYQFCFDNEFSAFSHKVVYFDVRKEQIDNLAVEAGNAVPTVKTAAESACDNIHEVMTMVVDYQRDYRLTEVMGRYVGEVINNGVMWWSVGQTFIVLIIGFGQVFILKTFFTEKSTKTPI